jgi:hypothetical protein
MQMPFNVRKVVAHSGLLARATLWLAFVRAGLTLSSYRTVRRLTLPASMAAAREVPNGDVDLMAWAVRRGARFVPGASCLTQAAAMQAMLARQSVASTVHLGVLNKDGGELRSHAWLEVAGRTTVGGPRRSLVGFTEVAFFGPTR